MLVKTAFSEYMWSGVLRGLFQLHHRCFFSCCAVANVVKRLSSAAVLTFIVAVVFSFLTLMCHEAHPVSLFEHSCSFINIARMCIRLCSG